MRRQNKAAQGRAERGSKKGKGVRWKGERNLRIVIFNLYPFPFIFFFPLVSKPSDVAPVAQALPVNLADGIVAAAERVR